MTKLEQDLINHVMNMKPTARERISLRKTPVRFIMCHFVFNGVYGNFITYDKEKQCFIEITYPVGVGPSVTIEGDVGAGYFDKIEMKSIDVSNIVFP